MRKLQTQRRLCVKNADRVLKGTEKPRMENQR